MSEATHGNSDEATLDSIKLEVGDQEREYDSMGYRLEGKKPVALGSFKCPECEAYYSSESNMMRHYRIKHTDRAKFQCDQCEYQADERSRLRAHINGMHNKVTFSCNKCDFTARWQSSLSIHKSKVHRVSRKIQ